MNPNVCEKRGCFFRKEEDGRFTVVDYPTWTFGKYGLFTHGQNQPVPDGVESERTFGTEAEAKKFCADENYVICRSPHDKTPMRADTPDYDAFED